MIRSSLRLKIVLLWVSANLAIAALVALLVYATISGLFLRQFLASKLSLVRTAAASIAGEIHSRFDSPEAAQDPEYLRCLAYLHNVKQHEPYLTYLYTLGYRGSREELYYAVDADIAERDTVWVESDYFAFWLSWLDGRLLIDTEEEQGRTAFPLEVRMGTSLPLEVRETGGLPCLWLGDVELLQVLERQPLVVATPAGQLSQRERERVAVVNLAGEDKELVLSFSKAGESMSTPGSLYVDTAENVQMLRRALAEGNDFVEQEAERDNYGLSQSACGIIRYADGQPAGLVVADFYQDELEAFRRGMLRTVGLIALLTFAAALATSLGLAQYLLIPLQRLGAAVRQVAAGQLDTRLQERRRDEFGELAGGFNHMLESLQRSLAQRQAAEAELSRLAYCDQLTGLPNRKSFQDRLGESLAVARRSEFEKLRGLLFLDLDRFKDVNDTLGHQVGDRVLQQAAGRIRECVRQSDLVFRLGGDEFTVLLSSLSGEADAALVAEKLVQAFADPIVVEANTVHVGLSVGIALYPRDGSAADELVRSADTALFEAKQERRAFRYFAQGMQKKATEKMTMVNGLHRGLSSDQFALHFQPVMDMQERLAGCEALLRWSHPEWGSIPPVQFIPLAEETGLIIPLGRLGIRAACRLLHRLAGTAKLRISVNLSPKQLRDHTLVQDVDACLQQYLVDPSRLELEITESGLMDEPSALSRIEELHSRGIRFSIDDFGTGYSSLSRLRSLPIDTLKIDRGFVAGIPGSRKDSDLVRAVITIAHGLGLSVCAEGVETRDQLDFLRDAGCDTVQGYLFSPPVPEEAFLEIVRTRPPAP
jgi:diguanylate cyclase (GGDEF)-like protein